MPNSINSLSPTFRDFLLNRNLVTDTVTNNGLTSLLYGIGLPKTDTGTPPEAVQASTDILTNGSFYKDLNLITNQFQGTDDDYQLVNITYQSNLPPTSAFIYSSNYSADNGILKDTVNTPANGPFQGGNIREFNASRNLYSDPSGRVLRSLDDVFAPNVQYTNYQDINNGVISNSIDVLGSIFTGGGIGVGPNGKLVPDFDLRSTLLGRVLGGTGVISDTPLGQAGAKYLALALANNAAFGLQQETIGHLNLNPLNIAMNGVGSILVPNYSITVPTSTSGKILDFGARVLGFEVPVSIYERNASIFASENPIANIDRANAQIANTGKGQVLAMFSNIKQNEFRPGFEDNRGNGNGLITPVEGVNPNLYAFTDNKGGVIDFLNITTSIPNGNGEGMALSENGRGGTSDNVNSPISQSNYNLDGLIENSGFNGVPAGSVSPMDYLSYTNDGQGTFTKFSWGDVKDNKKALEIFPSDGFTSPNSILTKTQSLFNSGRMRTLVSGEVGTRNKMNDPIQTAVREGGLVSKGSGVLTPEALKGNFKDVDNVFCRTWSTFNRYNQVQDLQKNSGIDSNMVLRKGYVNGDSVLGDNGFVKIGGYVGDVVGNEPVNVKNYMFSIENLAWADSPDLLIPCEKGPGDLMTGISGRIMWFPPYDLSVSENTSVSWEATNFIGRGEPIYTYSNTERSGTLQFKIVVDHPSYLNAIRNETDDYIASFFAGCTDIDPKLAEKLTVAELSQIENKDLLKPKVKTIDPQTPDITKFSVYLPNDVSVPFEYPTYEDKFSTDLGTGVGTTKDSGTVSITKATSTDRNNFGLNGDKNTGLESEGGWITEAGKNRLRNALNVQCPACTISVKGYASDQGQKLNSKGNKTIRINRGKELRKWIEENILNTDPNIISGKITFADRFKPFKDSDLLGEVVYCNEPNKEVFDTECLKKARKSVAEFKFDAELADKLIGKVEPPVIKEEQFRVGKKITNRFYTECNYFEKLRQEDSVVYNSLKEKLRFFHPAFHAITPEGLNSRLTFLQQCTRQGPTGKSGIPDNLAFGRPPVCILRLGDFYHSKIVIDNVGISYEPLVWDLNPEGIGVQPMIATVDLSFKMIGGQSMKGPINKLQNAVSFNFFGNTQIYEERADKLVKNSEPNKGNYIIDNGISVLTGVQELSSEEKQDGINGNGSKTLSTNQETVAENVNTQQEETTNTNEPSIKELTKITVGNWGGDKHDIRVNMIFNNLDNNSTDEVLESFVNKNLKLTIDTVVGSRVTEEFVIKDTPTFKSIDVLISGGYDSPFGFYFGDIYETDSDFPKINIPSGTYLLTVTYNGNRFSTKPFTVD